MHLRTMTSADLPQLDEIDGTIESTRYLHLERSGEGLAITWKLEERPLREKLIEPARLDDETRFLARQITSGADEGWSLIAEHDNAIVAMLLAQPDPQGKTMAIKDLRVDYDHRREGIATALLFQLIHSAREQTLRAVSSQSKTNNIPAAALLSKCGFDLTGVDTHRHSNHDLVKEQITLFWYAALD